MKRYYFLKSSLTAIAKLKNQFEQIHCKNFQIFTNSCLSYITIVMLFLSICGSAQTTIVAASGDGGFESGSTFAANGWTTVNSSTDAWALGNITSPGVDVGARSAFVSSTAGTTWAYSQFSTVQHLYRDFTPTTAGETLALLSFKWKVGGEGTEEIRATGTRIESDERVV